MKLKSFFFKSITFLLFILLIFSFSCSTFKYNLPEFTGQNDSDFLSHLYPIISSDTKTSINETLNFCSVFIDENGVFYSLIIELNKLNLNNTDFWFYELFFYDYSPLQKIGITSSSNTNQNQTNNDQNNNKNENMNLSPKVFKITSTSVNPMTPLKITDKTLNFGKNIFSWKGNTIKFELKDKKNSIKINAQLYPQNNFSLLGSPIIKQSLGQMFFFTSADLPVECEYTFYYSEKEKVKRKLKNGFGILYKSWGANSASEYELHFLKFSNFNFKDVKINPPDNLLNKSYLFFSIPKASFYSALEISRENNLPVFNLLQNFFPDNDYRYSKIIPDKNRRYPSNFSILLKNFLIRFNPIYEKSVVQFFTHDSWFGIVPVYDSAGRAIGLGFSNLYEYSRMK